MFVDAGTDNGTSVPFRVPAGAVEIDYRVTDREPWFGCRFGLELVAPEPDPLASGRVIASTDVFGVAPRSLTSGRLRSPSLLPGEYFLRYLGDLPCDWSVSVSRT